MKTQEEQIEEAIKALEFLETADPATEGLAVLLHTFDPRIPAYVQSLRDEINQNGATKAAGYLMEQIALLVFGGFRGHSELKSFQSAGAQYDLVLAGDGSRWLKLCKFLWIEEGSSILVEAKAIAKPIGDSDFARLCALLDHNLSHAGMGILFTMSGASGFPTPKRRKRSLQHSRLRQALYYAKTRKPILVFDQDDISQISDSGALILLLRRKLRDIEELGGLTTQPASDLVEVDLPAHLKALLPFKPA